MNNSVKSNELFKLLKNNKSIIAVLDGDTKLGEYKNIDLKMPYLSGPKICELSNSFGFPMEYDPQNAFSRWQYFSDLMGMAIENDKLPKLLLYLFNKKRIYDDNSNVLAVDRESVYNDILKGALMEINQQLLNGDYELVLSRDSVFIRRLDSGVSVMAPEVDSLNRDYILSVYNRANANISNGNFDSAITQARTLLEEVFQCVLEKKGAGAERFNGDINRMFKRVRELYNMHSDPNMDRRFKELISGLNSIVKAIAELRNTAGDAHGVGYGRVHLRDYYARVLVNSAVTVADFIWSVADYAEKNKW